MFNRYVKNKYQLIKLMEINKDVSSYINYILQSGAGSKKWDILKHNGVLFYPEYKPHYIPIL